MSPEKVALLYCTHDHDEKSQATDNQSIRHELYQRDVREEGLDVLGERDDPLMLDNQCFHDAFGDASLDVRNFTEFLSHYIDLSTRVKNLHVGDTRSVN